MILDVKKIFQKFFGHFPSCWQLSILSLPTASFPDSALSLHISPHPSSSQPPPKLPFSMATPRDESLYWKGNGHWDWVVSQNLIDLICVYIQRFVNQNHWYDQPTGCELYSSISSPSSHLTILMEREPEGPAFTCQVLSQDSVFCGRGVCVRACEFTQRFSWNYEVKTQSDSKRNRWILKYHKEDCG